MERHMRKTLPHSKDIYTSDVFEILFGYEVTRSKLYPSPLALLHIEMDPIALNADLLAAAPTVFAAALNSHLRSVDIPSTYGKSFRVLLPSSNEHGARAVCERLLSVYRNKFDVPNGSIAFSLHIGVTAHNGGPEMSAEEILQKAEEALKQSRLKGPNTYVML